jgi:hypothetical protein
MEILSAIMSAPRGRALEGPTEDRDYEVGEFERLELSGPFDVVVSTGSPPSVRASGSQSALDALSVEQDGDRVAIDWDGGWACDLEVAVTVPALKSVRMTGSGDVSVDRVKGDSFECATNGSGDLDVEEIEVQRLKLRSVGSGDLRIDKLRSADIEASLTGSGDLDIVAIESTALKLTMDGSGDAAIDD